MKKSLFLTVFCLSIAGMLLWLVEITQVKGWYGLNWLEGRLFSPYLVSLFPAIAFLLPFICNKQITSSKKIILAGTLLYISNIICYELGRILCYSLYYRFWFSGIKDVVILISIAIATPLFSGFSYWIVTNKLIRKVKKYIVFLMSGITILTVLFSLVTIYFFQGFGSQDDWIDAVKMGYPCFWTTLFYGLAGMMLSKKNKTVESIKI